MVLELTYMIFVGAPNSLILFFAILTESARGQRKICIIGCYGYILSMMAMDVSLDSCSMPHFYVAESAAVFGQWHGYWRVLSNIIKLV